MFLGSPQNTDIRGIEFFVFFLVGSGWGGGGVVLLPELYCMYFSFEA